MKLPVSHFYERFLIAWQAYERTQRRKVTAQELADALEVSAGLVSQWQRAEEPPPHERIRKIAAVCNVDPGWLAYWPNTSAKAPGDGGVGDFEQTAAENFPAPRATPSTKTRIPRPGEGREEAPPNILAPPGTPLYRGVAGMRMETPEQIEEAKAFAMELLEKARAAKKRKRAEGE